MAATVLDDWIRRICSKDAVTFEDAYFGDRPTGAEVIPRLVEELMNAKDPYTRGKFCELLGEMGDETVIHVLERELGHPEKSVRRWAKLALDELRSPEKQASKQEHLKLFGSRYGSE